MLVRTPAPGATGIFAELGNLLSWWDPPSGLFSLIAFFSVLWFSYTGFLRSTPKYFTLKVVVHSTVFHSQSLFIAGVWKYSGSLFIGPVSWELSQFTF